MFNTGISSVTFKKLIELFLCLARQHQQYSKAFLYSPLALRILSVAGNYRIGLENQEVVSTHLQNTWKIEYLMLCKSLFRKCMANGEGRTSGSSRSDNRFNTLMAALKKNKENAKSAGRNVGSHLVLELSLSLPKLKPSQPFLSCSHFSSRFSFEQQELV